MYNGFGDSPMPYFGATGWICHKCGRTYSPSTPSCFVCGGENKVTTSNNTEAKPPSLLDIFNPTLFENHAFMNKNPLMEDPTPKAREEQDAAD